MPIRLPRLFVRAAAIASVSLAAGTLPAQQPDTPEVADIIVHVVHAEPPTGTLEISLFASTEDFLARPFLQTSGPVNPDGSHVARFGKVPYGDYAVVVVHDANDNGKLDNGFLGFGGERYAYSNDASTLFGRPDFDQVKFAVKGETRVEITLE